MAFPLTAFPRQRKLKCWFIYTPHCIGLQVRLDLSPGYGSTVMSGSVSGLHLFQTRQAPRAPLHGARCYLAHQGVSHPGQQALPRLHRSYGLMRQSYALLVPRCYPCTLGLRRLLPAPAGRRTFPTLFCESFLTCLDPYPGGPQGALLVSSLRASAFPDLAAGRRSTKVLDSHFSPGGLLGAAVIH